MKRFLVAVMFGLMAIAAQAEASFDQIEGLIQQKNYAAAASGLEVIIQNHPKSSKAFYAMAQAQAGLGNLEKANKALNIATGLNPTLDFAPSSSVASLKQAITPQVSKIEAVEETHTVRNTVLIIFVLALGFVVYMVYRRNKEIEDKFQESERQHQAEEYARAEAKVKRMQEEREAEEKAEAERVAKVQAAEEALKAHKNYNHERFDPVNPDKLKSVTQFKKEQQEAARVLELREAQARADAAEASARMYRTSAQTVAQPTHTTVVNNSGNDMLTGILVGNMLSGSHHDTTRVVEREVIREVPAPSRSSSWDDTPSTPSRSSSWDDTPSRSSSSSSWDSGSSSSSSSSWSDSSSSSSSDSSFSDSSSSSSWD